MQYEGESENERDSGSVQITEKNANSLAGIPKIAIQMAFYLILVTE